MNNKKNTHEIHVVPVDYTYEYDSDADCPFCKNKVKKSLIDVYQFACRSQYPSFLTKCLNCHNYFLELDILNFDEKYHDELNSLKKNVLNLHFDYSDFSKIS